MKQTGTTSIRGFFPAVGIEEISALTREQRINNGRRGIFYTKKKLIETLEKNCKAINTAEINIVEIHVPKDAVMDHSGKDEEKFGVKSKHSVPIIRIQSFEEAQKETKMRTKTLATA